MFSISSELKTLFPLIPTTQEEYCALLPALVKSLGIETNELNEEENNEFSKSLTSLSDGLVILKYNELENEDLETLGFSKGSFVKGLKTTTSAGDEVDTGNIKFFVHGLDYENQLMKFDAFALPDTDALLSVSYTERPESKYRFFRVQGVILDVDNKYICGGGNTDSGSGCGKNIKEFINNYAYFGANRHNDRTYVADMIKEALNLNDEEYIEFVQKNKDKSFSEITPKEDATKILKAFSSINSNTRRGNRSYNEMYLTNPRVMGVFAYPPYDVVGDTINFANSQSEFLRRYAIEHDVPMVVFGD